MSSLDRFNILLERIETLDEMADSFKRTVRGAAGGEDGLNLILKAYRNERTGKPVGAVSRVKNLIVLRALYDKDYINDEQFQALAKKATSSNYISNTLKEINPEAHDKLFGSAQESDDIVKHIKLNAKDMLNFGLTNLQGKNYVEVQEDEPEDPDAKELEDDVTSEVISLAKGLTSADVEGTILDFDDVDVLLDGLENKDAITRKLVSILNGAGYTAEATGAGFNVEAPIGSFGTEEKVQDLMAGLILKHFPGVDENLIDVKLNTTIEDAESFNEKPDLPGEVTPELSKKMRTVSEILRDDEDSIESLSDSDLINHAHDEGIEEHLIIDGEGGLVNRDEIIKLLSSEDAEEDSLEARVQAALSSGGIDKGDARDIQRNSDAAFENILSPAIETARQDPDMTYAEVKGMIEAELGRKCTEDECKDIKHDLYNMHGEEGDQERAEAVLDAEDNEHKAVFAKIDQDVSNGVGKAELEDTYGAEVVAAYIADGEAKDKFEGPMEDAEGAADGAMKGIKAKERLNYIDNIVFTYEGKDLDWYKKALFKNPLFKDKKLTPYELKVLNRAMLSSEDYEGNETTVTENFENQRHLNVTKNSTSMYLTEQASKDARNKSSQKDKDTNQSQSFRERYKPKTHWQLEELRRYGL